MPVDSTTGSLPWDALISCILILGSVGLAAALLMALLARRVKKPGTLHGLSCKIHPRENPSKPRRAPRL